MELETGFRTGIVIDIKTQPDKTTNAAEANLLRAKARRVTRGDARHFREVVDGSKFHVARSSYLAHDFELTSDAFSSSDARLSSAVENFLDRIESGVINAFAKSEVKRARRRNIVKRQHLKCFKNRKRNVAR